MTVDEAYDFLGVDRADRGNLEKVKMRFRKMCLKWHPDKNRGRERQALGASFRRCVITFIYGTLLANWRQDLGRQGRCN